MSCAIALLLSCSQPSEGATWKVLYHGMETIKMYLRLLKACVLVRPHPYGKAFYLLGAILLYFTDFLREAKEK